MSEEGLAVIADAIASHHVGTVDSITCESVGVRVNHEITSDTSTDDDLPSVDQLKALIDSEEGITVQKPIPQIFSIRNLILLTCVVVGSITITRFCFQCFWRIGYWIGEHLAAPEAEYVISS
jgi:hypothetical protein